MPRILTVDAFSTGFPFTGNPAAVCLLDAPADDAWQQGVAGEMNLSETAFLLPGATEGEWGLRWFTPTVEIDLCGHATLASAHVLWSEGVVAAGTPLRFATRSGELVARPAEGAIELDFPALPATEAEPPPALLGSLAVEAVRTAWNGVDWLVEVATAAEVVALAPDMALLATVPCRGVAVTAVADEGDEADFVSRFFGPATGVDEDPVTGSAHCTLGPWWAPRLGRDELVGHQVSARGGRVGVLLGGDRVRLSGRAVTVLRGELLG